MSFATEIYKDEKLKRELLRHFPMPKGKHLLEKQKKIKNPNPSLIGNALETFIDIAFCSQITFKRKFEAKFLIARKNIESIKKNTNRNLQVSGDSVSYITKEELIRARKHIDSLNTNTMYLSKVKSSINILKITHPDFYEIPLKRRISFQLAEKIDNNSFNSLLIDKESLSKFYERTIKEFEDEARKFIKEKKLSKRLITIVILFTHISSPWFMISHPINIFSELKQLNSFLFPLCKRASNLQNILKGKIILKPKMHSYRVLATPDYIIGNSILEIKSSQKILTTSEYIQGLVYLIFSQTEDNLENYGKIDSVNIYYAYHDYLYTINLSQIVKKLNYFRKLFERKSIQIEKSLLK